MEKEIVINYLKNNPTKNSEVLIDFVKKSQDLYSRSNIIGHITGSAFICNYDLTEVLLVEHKKYNMWVVPGGHVDPNENMLEASHREAEEETSLTDLELLTSEILDIDIHRIAYSEKKNEPEHWHFDVRYLFKAKKDAKVNIDLNESNAFKWVNIKELTQGEDLSLQRQAIKALKFLDTLKKETKLKIN